MPPPTQPAATGRDDTLAPVSARFSLGATYADLPFSQAPPSDAGSRPFVLRVAGMPAPHRAATLPPARYCPQRQLAVSDDDLAEPVYLLGRDRTTVGSKDGNPNPMEDWTYDK